jgi:Cu2+-exporting ATPase
VGEQLHAVAGGGVTGLVEQRTVAVGSPRFLTSLGVADVPEQSPAHPGNIAALVACGGRDLGMLALEDQLRTEAPALAAYFRRNNIRSILLSGDRRETVQHVAAALGIDDGIGEMLPADKASFIDGLRGRGEITLMTGDGINDAPALSAADVGCAIAGGTDIALETSDLVLVKPDLARLAVAHRIARQTMTVVRQNLGWAFIYNIVGIPLAMTGQLTPIYAAAAMALSSLCVVGNSLRITGVKHG